MLRLLCINLVIYLTACMYARETCPIEENPDSEISIPGLVPITHPDSFLLEPQQYGYYPRFDPGFVTFDPNDRPYFHTHNRRADSICGPASQGWFDQDLVETLDSHGRWISIDLVAWGRATLPEIDGLRWDGCFRSGTEYDERVVFDRSGAAYTYIAATQANIPYGILMYSADGGSRWVGYWLKTVSSNDDTEGWQATLEFQDGNNVIDGPPSILIHGWFGQWIGPDPLSRDLYLQVPVKSGSGLIFPPPVRVTTTPNALSVTEHSGASNKIVRSNTNLSHIVFAATTAPMGVTCLGTPTYARTFDHTRGTFLNEPVYLGCAGEDGYGVAGPDAHNTPAIALDSKGYLHVVLGAHQGSLQYMKSLVPNSTDAWTSPVKIGRPRDPNDGGYTYVSLLCDRLDRLHMVARYAGLGYKFRLVYLQMTSDGIWAPGHRDLIVPESSGYAVYHHKLNMDSQGNLYLNYLSWPKQLSDTQASAYGSQYPDDSLQKDCSACRTRGSLIPFQQAGQSSDGSSCTYCDTPGGCSPPPYCDYMNTAAPHAPSLLTSKDGGESWHLATTRDFN